MFIHAGDTLFDCDKVVSLCVSRTPGLEYFIKINMLGGEIIGVYNSNLSKAQTVAYAVIVAKQLYSLRTLQSQTQTHDGVVEMVKVPVSELGPADS